MPDIDRTIDTLIGPHGKMVVRDIINLCKNEWKMSKDETMERVAEKFSYNAEIEKAAVTYAYYIYEFV